MSGCALRFSTQLSGKLKERVDPDGCEDGQVISGESVGSTIGSGSADIAPGRRAENCFRSRHVWRAAGSGWVDVGGGAGRGVETLTRCAVTMGVNRNASYVSFGFLLWFIACIWSYKRYRPCIAWRVMGLHEDSVACRASVRRGVALNYLGKPLDCVCGACEVRRGLMVLVKGRAASVEAG